MQNLLITGASGMLGATLAKSLKPEFNVYGTGNSDFKTNLFNYKKFDLLNNNYDDIIVWSKPNIIIHCGAITDGDYCEKNSISAFNVNGFSLNKILNSTDKSVKIIYISTDAVFPSSLHLANELDYVSPENIYGKSKELGEFFLNSSTNRCFTIIRTTIVGLNINKLRKGFVEWIINSAQGKKELGLFNDVLFTPISIWDLKNEIKFLIKSNNINSETLHIGGELCTKYDFGKKILEALNLSTSKLKKSSILDFNNRSRRSLDQSLSSTFYEGKYNRKLPSLSQTITILKKKYNE